MAPETKWARRGFVALGALSVICIIGAGLLNSISQSRLTTTINKMAANVRKLAEPANARRDASVDQILLAATSKLIQQDKEIQHLQRSVHSITHPANAIYLGNSIVAQAEGNVRKDGNTLTFQLIVARGTGLDFGQEFTFQKFKIKCARPGMVGQQGTFGVMVTRYPNTKCTIMGES